jgi:hypothetical protein
VVAPFTYNSSLMVFQNYEVNVLSYCGTTSYWKLLHCYGEREWKPSSPGMVYTKEFPAKSRYDFNGQDISKNFKRELGDYINFFFSFFSLVLGFFIGLQIFKFTRNSKTFPCDARFTLYYICYVMLFLL